MTAKDTVVMSLETAKNWLMTLVSDVRNAPLAFPTAKGGNHPLWVVGHLALAEGSLVRGFIQGEANPLAQWESLFGMNSQPVADASKYPSIDELIAALEKERAHTLQLVASLSDADLDRPSKAPPEFASMFGTVGQCLTMTALHMTFHAGQVADARRQLGRPPVFG